jgi:phosphoribosylformimino-5-aminoimidazole carboxamide ribotide isomerase
MELIPAIDLKGGRCVRLIQGRLQEETVYAEDPVAVAVGWEKAGAGRLHVVDLEGAVQGRPVHAELIARIRDAVGIPLQLGGGIRDRKDAERYLNMGVDRVVIGTEAIRNPAFTAEICRAFPGRVAVGIDARDGRVAIQGWTETTGTLAVDLARGLEESGAAAFIFTDIHRDGMQSGPNIDQTRKMAESVSVPVIASGGVGSLEHIRALLALEPAGVSGVIVGKALYSGAVSFEDARALLAHAAPAYPAAKTPRS